MPKSKSYCDNWTKHGCDVTTQNRTWTKYNEEILIQFAVTTNRDLIAIDCGIGKFLLFENKSELY